MLPVVPFPSIIPFSGFEEDDLMNVILQAEFDGRLKTISGEVSAAGDLVALTAAAGKDLYLTAAQCTVFIEAGAFNPNVFQQHVVSKAGAVILERSKNGLVSFVNASLADVNYTYNFENLGYKVGPGGILKLEVLTLSTNIGVTGFIQAVEVPTGENPATYTGA